MPSLPLPIIVALLLLLLAATNQQTLRETATGRVFLSVLLIYAVSMALIGLRWSLDMVTLLPLVATLAIVSSALLYLAFCSLGRPGPVIVFSRDWIHLLPVLAVAASTLLLQSWVDVLVIAAKLFYAVLLARLALRAPDTLKLVRLSWLKNAQLALWGATVLLIVSIMLDIVITIDFARYDGRHAENLVGWMSFANLLLLGWATVKAGQGRTVEHLEVAQTNTPSTSESKQNLTGNRDSGGDDKPSFDPAEDARLLEKLNTLLIDDRLYADTELNLQRLARKAGVPARTVSRVVNANTNQNLSQWINNARVNAACTALSDQKVSVNQAMLEAGFVTKSNFNREFRRLKGCSPSQWREINGE